MPPEHIRGDEADHRADIYSVGVMIFELLTGRLPFDRPSVEELFEAHLNEEPPTCKECGASDVPRALELVVHSCLSKYPAERPQSAWELASMFGKAIGMRLMEAPGQAAPGPELAAAAPTQPQEPDAVVHEFDAYMPERLAVAKLRGFVDDVGGQLVASDPGVIRISLGGSGCRYRLPASGALSWFGLGSKRRQISLELRMAKIDPGHSAQLHITILLRPEMGGSLPEDPRYHDCFAQIYTDLRGYLMAERT
jgi:hypothetical protein